MLPQLRMMQNAKVVEKFTAHYVFALGLSRFVSCAHWVLQVGDFSLCELVEYLLSSVHCHRCCWRECTLRAKLHTQPEHQLTSYVRRCRSSMATRSCCKPSAQGCGQPWCCCRRSCRRSSWRTSGELQSSLTLRMCNCWFRHQYCFSFMRLTACSSIGVHEPTRMLPDMAAD